MMSPIEKDKVVLLGTRGSCPVSGNKFHKYGGATLSVLVRLGGRPLLIDCGTGMLSLKKNLSSNEKRLPVLISHAHLDHILGLAASSFMFESGNSLDIYGKTITDVVGNNANAGSADNNASSGNAGNADSNSNATGGDIATQIGALFSRPLWPVGLNVFPAKTIFHEIKINNFNNGGSGSGNAGAPATGGSENASSAAAGSVMLNAPEGFTVRVLEGNHPGGVCIFRIEGAGGGNETANATASAGNGREAKNTTAAGISDVQGAPKILVYCSDCTLDDATFAQLKDFAKDCDLLICDGQYSESEWPDYKDFGHSTWNTAVQLAKDCGAKRLRIVHHSPYRTDAELDAFQEVMSAMCEKYRAETGRPDLYDFSFGCDGEEIIL